MKRFALSLFTMACTANTSLEENPDQGLRVLDGYNYATIVIALRKDGKLCHIQDGSE
jgi:hypothetical protein